MLAVDYDIQQAVSPAEVSVAVEYTSVVLVNGIF
jgi:hypothetical protein